MVQPIIIAVTGHTERKYTEKALNSGMNKVIFKPCSSTDVEQIINKIGFEKNEQNNRLESLIQP